YMFFFNDTATTEIYTLSLHDALPIFGVGDVVGDDRRLRRVGVERRLGADGRSEEHTSELQSPMYLGCRLLLEERLRRGHSLGHLSATPRMASRLARTADSRATRRRHYSPRRVISGPAGSQRATLFFTAARVPPSDPVSLPRPPSG